MDDNTRAQLLSEVISRTSYISLVFKHIQVLGVRVDRTEFLYGFKPETGDSRLLKLEPGRTHPEPSLWCEVTAAALEDAVSRSRLVQNVVVRTGRNGHQAHPRVERLVLRCFEMPPFPLDDRTELIYPGLFGFAEPKVLWRSATSGLQALYYPNSGFGGFAVSSGLTDLAFATAESNEQGAAGTGYELVLQSTSGPVVQEFVGWVRYIQDTRQQLVPGNWLEFEGGKCIRGTDVYGFVVIYARIVPPYFMVGDLSATFHELIPVNQSQLAIAKEQGVTALGYFA